MKLHQLRYLAAIAQNASTSPPRPRNCTRPSRACRSRSSCSRRTRVPDLRARRRNLSRVTSAGQQVIDRAVRILRECRTSSASRTTSRTRPRVALDRHDAYAGALRPAWVIKQFRRPVTPRCACTCTRAPRADRRDGALDRIDFAIATGSQSLFEGYSLLPCYRWHRTSSCEEPTRSRR